VLVLVIDTSSAAVTAGLAEVADEVTMRAERVTLNARGHGELLAPSIAQCLTDASARPAELAAVVAGIGPGPFTGLRVGLVTAAVFAQTLGIPAYGVCSLDAIGDACRDEPALLVAADARRKEVYWARYTNGVPTAGPSVDRPAEVPAEGLTAVAGQGAELFDFGVRQRPERYPAARSLARLAADRIRGAAPSEVLVPLYLRRPDAVVPTASGRDGEPVSSAEIAIVPMRAEHIDLLMPYERVMFGTEAWSASGYRSELADTERRYYVAAVTGDQLLGWAGVMVIADTAEILTVGVVPEARRRGFARRLVDALLEEARRRGAVEAFLEVRVDNVAAQSLYFSEGFAQVGLRPGYYDGGRIDAVVMRREL
jgi:tRNA threonylcarbamoyl adenosine modification protein YeaZ/ribosomal-protein-alanine acetyltransferase